MKKYLTISFLILALAGLGVLAAAEKEPASTVDEISLLRAELKMLRETIQNLQEQNAKLTEEVKLLTGLCQKAGIDIRKSKSPATTQPVEATSRPKDQDSNTIVAKAIHEFIATVDKVEKSNATDIQKRKSWLEAAKNLDSILRKNSITISYTIEDVEVDRKGKSALLKISSARIRSSDRNVADIEFNRFYQVSVFSTEAMAAKITKDSTLTIEGLPALNVVLSKPPEKQPSLYDETRMPGYRPLGNIQGETIPDSIGWDNVCLMIKDNCLVKVDGTPRKLE